MERKNADVGKIAVCLFMRHKNVLTALFKNPAKMAKAVGLEVEAFTKRLSVDANGAL